jgi:hypothetical protein
LVRGLGEAFQFANAAQDARMQRDLVQRQLDELEQQRKRGTSLEGLISSLEGLTPQQKAVITSAAQHDPRAAIDLMAKIPGLLAPVPEQKPELSDAGKKIRDLEAQLGRPLTEREAFEAAGMGGMFDAPPATEDDLDKVLTTSDLESYRLPDGSKLTPGSTLRDARDKGALPYTAAEVSQQRAEESGAVTLQTLRDLAIGENGVFIDNGGGPITNTVPGRLMGGLSNATGTFFGTEASRARDRYNRLRTALYLQPGAFARRVRKSERWRH